MKYRERYRIEAVLWTVPLLVTALFPSHVPAATGNFDLKGFRQLSADDQLSTLIAALATRDAQLANCRCSFTANLTRHPYEKPDRLSETVAYDFSRLDGSLKLHVKRCDATGEVTSDFVTGWDGSQETGLIRYNNTDHGTVQNVPGDYWHLIDFLNIMGCLRPDEPVSVADWLGKQVGRKGIKTTIDTTTWREQPIIRLRIEDARIGVTEEYSIDQNRQFMVVAYTYLYSEGKGFNKSDVSLAQMTEIDGVWLPKAVIERASTSVTPSTSSWEYKLVSFSLASVNAKDVKVTFPVGTEVMDNSHHSAYKISATDEHVEIPFMDGVTGKMVFPTTRPATQPAPEGNSSP